MKITAVVGVEIKNGGKVPKPDKAIRDLIVAASFAYSRDGFAIL